MVLVRCVFRRRLAGCIPTKWETIAVKLGGVPTKGDRICFDTETLTNIDGERNPGKVVGVVASVVYISDAIQEDGTPVAEIYIDKSENHV